MFSGFIEALCEMICKAPKVELAAAMAASPSGVGQSCHCGGGNVDGKSYSVTQDLNAEVNILGIETRPRP